MLACRPNKLNFREACFLGADGSAGVDAYLLSGIEVAMPEFVNEEVQSASADQPAPVQPPTQATPEPSWSAPDDPGATQRSENIRWGVCFVIVLAAYGAAAFALLRSPDSDDFGVASPVVLVDLVSLAAVDTPFREVAPGPLVQEESEPQPQKEETKPEIESDVALPEPPKPETPPVEVKQATAPQAARAPQQVVMRWESQLVAHIEHYKQYPLDARARGEQGEVRVAFTIDREGWVQSSRIVRSSGAPELDQETLALLTRAQPLPKPPNNVTTRELSFVIPIRFAIR
jgi:periplasmic protein TonB